MGSRIHVLSQLSGLASYLRKQLLNRVANDVSLKSIVGDIEIVDVQPKNGIYICPNQSNLFWILKVKQENLLKT